MPLIRHGILNNVKCIGCFAILLYNVYDGKVSQLYRQFEDDAFLSHKHPQEVWID